ncbi:MAG: aspartate aminotransferase family protein [Balneolaceae bacterium]
MSHNRKSSIEMDKEEFRKIGYQLIDAISDFTATIRERPVTKGEASGELKKIIGASPLPEHGTPAAELLTRTADLLFNHSLLNGHPKFLGYITSSAAPIGALADLLAASVNPNMGAQILSPVATEIEKQTIKWLAEFIGVSPDYGGILVSGGNMANFTAFLAARTAKLSGSIKEDGLSGIPVKPVIYCSKTTHTWIEKAANLFGFGSRSIRWIQTDSNNKIDTVRLEQAIKDDLENGFKPMMVAGVAGDVSTGVVDDLKAIALVCKTYDLWFHVDGAYGIPAAAVPEQKKKFEGITEADSIALDPHKWWYSPLEAGCTLVKNPRHLTDTFSTHPEYYNFDGDKENPTHNFYEYGLQNSRGFRALKVWLALQQAGRRGYVQMIGEDIELSRYMFEKAREHPELEAITQNLSITTLRYVPPDFESHDQGGTYLDTLNETLLNKLQQDGELFLSHAVVDGKYCLRGCIVNFRTSKKDIEEMIDIIAGEGRKLHQKLYGHSTPE